MIVNLFQIFLIFISLICRILSKECQISNDDFHAAQVILSVSPRMDVYGRRQVNIYWHNHNFKDGDILAIYDQDNLNDEPVFSFEPEYFSGWRELPVYAKFLETYTVEETCLRKDIIVRRLNNEL